MIEAAVRARDSVLMDNGYQLVQHSTRDAQGAEHPMIDPTVQQRLFGIEEVSARTGLPVWRIYSEVAASRMPCKRVGRRIYFSESDVRRYLDRIQHNGIAQE